MKRLTKAERYACGVTLEDMPQELPESLLSEALDVLRSLNKQLKVSVYLGLCRKTTPPEMRGRWLVYVYGLGYDPDRPPFTLRQWTYHYVLSQVDAGVSYDA